MANEDEAPETRVVEGWTGRVFEDFAVGDPSTVKEVPPAKPATRAKMVSF